MIIHTFIHIYLYTCEDICHCVSVFMYMFVLSSLQRRIELKEKIFEPFEMVLMWAILLLLYDEGLLNPSQQKRKTCFRLLKKEEILLCRFHLLMTIDLIGKQESLLTYINKKKKISSVY